MNAIHHNPDSIDNYVPPDLPQKCIWSAIQNKELVDPHHHHINDPKPKILDNILQQIGNTPLVRLNKIPKQYGIKCEMLAKCEFFNAGGSVKDRISVRMVEEAEREGLLKPSSTIIEPTSGNTGIGMALVSAVKGYRCVIVMPEKASNEKAYVIQALGAEIIRTPTTVRYDSPHSNLSVSQKLCHSIKDAIVLGQYRNSGNPLAHYDTTAEEILTQCDHKVDMIVIGTGTGGTVTGIGRKFKEQLPHCTVVGVDPYGSILAEPPEINKTNVTYFEVEGLGYDFIPSVLDRSVVDKWHKSDDKSSFEMARKLILEEGLLCGGSSGSALVAALEFAKDLTESQRCVVILPDGIRNYMTKFLDDAWMEERKFGQLEINIQKPWFWDQSINNLLKGMNVESVAPNAKCKDAIKVMKKHAFDQMPVLDGVNQLLIGMVTIGHIMANLSHGNITLDSNVSEVVIKTYPKVERNANLWTITQILKTNPYVVVYDKITESEHRIAAVITHIDILDYLSELDQ